MTMYLQITNAAMIAGCLAGLVVWFRGWRVK